MNAAILGAAVFLALLRALRLHQWVKNLFVVAPVVFARRFDEPETLARAVIAFLCFGLASSAVYLFNDLRDVEADRLHPVKRHRPIASGRLSESFAARASVSLAAVALLGSFGLRVAFGLVVLGYLVLNVFYTLRIKRIPYLDVLSIALGFELRVLGGALAVRVPPSDYLLIVTFLLAAFLGFGKRFHELNQVSQQGAQRAVLRRYSTSWLERLLWATALATLAAYFLYTVDPRTVRALGTARLWWTVPSAAFGVFRFAVLVHHSGRAESPTETMLTDVPFVVNLIAWAVLVFVLLYSEDFGTTV